MPGRSSLRLDRMDAVAQPTIFRVQQSLKANWPFFCARPRGPNAVPAVESNMTANQG